MTPRIGKNINKHNNRSFYSRLLELDINIYSAMKSPQYLIMTDDRPINLGL